MAPSYKGQYTVSALQSVLVALKLLHSNHTNNKKYATQHKCALTLMIKLQSTLHQLNLILISEHTRQPSSSTAETTWLLPQWGEWMAILAAITWQTIQTQQKRDTYAPSYLTLAWKNISCTSGVTLVQDFRVVSRGLSPSSAPCLRCENHYGKLCCLRHHCGPKHQHVTFASVENTRGKTRKRWFLLTLAEDSNVRRHTRSHFK